VSRCPEKIFGADGIRLKRESSWSKEKGNNSINPLKEPDDLKGKPSDGQRVS